MTVWLDVTIDDAEYVYRFEREAPGWPTVPRVGEKITGPRGSFGFSSEVVRVWWHSDGDVSVGFGLLDQGELAGILPNEGWDLVGEPHRKKRPAGE
jgi:hypothetical protein